MSRSSKLQPKKSSFWAIIFSNYTMSLLNDFSSRFLKNFSCRLSALKHQIENSRVKLFHESHEVSLGEESLANKRIFMSVELNDVVDSFRLRWRFPEPEADKPGHARAGHFLLNCPFDFWGFKPLVVLFDLPIIEFTLWFGEQVKKRLNFYEIFKKWIFDGNLIKSYHWALAEPFIMNSRRYR